MIAGIFTALLGCVALLAMRGDHGDSAVKAQDAAIVGDVVTLRNAASTILCEDRQDASKIHMIGEVTRRQSNFFDKDAGKAVMKRDIARNAAMGETPSCQWAPRGGRYTVKKKEIVGTQNDDFHVVAYCLQPTDKSACFWIEETFDDGAPIEKTAGKF